MSDQKGHDAAEAAMWDAFDDLWAIVPTTMAGVQKLMDLALAEVRYLDFTDHLPAAMASLRASPVLGGANV